MKKIHCLNPIASCGTDLFPADYELTDTLAEADGVLVRSASMHEMELPEGLLAVGRAGAGVNNIPLEECSQKGIVVFNTPGANANGVKELVFAGMLLAARDIIGGANWAASREGDPEVAKKTEKEKKRFAGSELLGKKLGIIGLGAIGVQVANAAYHFGMDVYGFDPYISVEAAWNLSRNIHHISDVEEIYRKCDYITIHVPLTDSTRHMIDAKALEMMKPGVVIVNYSRDLLVDEEAVLSAIEAGKVHRYVTDFPNAVTAGKPGVIATPHLGASTAESEDNCAAMAVNELKNFLEHGNIRNSVNYPNCDLGKCTAPGRIAIYHRNVKKMISRFAEILSDTNIRNMSNTSKGAYAYTLIDLDEKADPEILSRLEAIEDVIKVRNIVKQ